MRREFLDPVNKYRGQYREIDERLRERRRRLDEVDKLTDQVKKCVSSCVEFRAPAPVQWYFSNKFRLLWRVQVQEGR
jgi:hypothetical protein